MQLHLWSVMYTALRHVIGASLQSFPWAVALNYNLPSSTMQSIIWPLSAWVISHQSDITHYCWVTYVPLHPTSSYQTSCDRLDYELADDIARFGDNKRIPQPVTELFPNAETPINNIVQVQSFPKNHWDSRALFATPQQWLLCNSVVDTNLGKTKLNNILKWRLIAPNLNFKNPDQLSQSFGDMGIMDGLVCR